MFWFPLTLIVFLVHKIIINVNLKLFGITIFFKIVFVWILHPFNHWATTENRWIRAPPDMFFFLYLGPLVSPLVLLLMWHFHSWVSEWWAQLNHNSTKRSQVSLLDWDVPEEARMQEWPWLIMNKQNHINHSISQ